jgi:nucleoside-diphosphate-sugar epimerase
VFAVVGAAAGSAELFNVIAVVTSLISTVIGAVVATRLDAALQAVDRYVQPLHVLGELKDTIACDISRARAELGYAPTVDLLDGMRASIRWCLERGQRL